MESSVRTFSPKASEITREWLVIDAEGLVLGRLATVAASLLRGKHRVYFAPHIDCGDNVIIVNADKGMVPKNRLGREIMGKLFVYAGPEHPHAAQTPTQYDNSAIRRG